MGAVVSAMGGSTIVAVTDRTGRFELRTLPPGPYLVRAHLAGYVTPPAQIIQVRSSARSASAISLRHTGASVPVLAAGIGAVSDPVPAVAPDSSDPGAQKTDDGETAWRLRHGRRSILKDVSLPADVLAGDDSPAVTPFGRGASATRATANFLTDMPFSGQVNLLSSFDESQQLFSPTSLPVGIANLRVSVPIGDHADWSVRGALTQSDMAAWNVAGAYVTRAPATHDYSFGVSSSAQRYDGGDPLAVEGATSSRSVGEVYAFDTFAVTPALAITYGSRYARYDYLDDRSLASPRIELAVTPAAHLRVSARLSQRAQAPGAEEFLPPSDSGIWLPPQRMFSSLDPSSPLRAERATDAALEVARDLGGATLSVRAFHQHTDDQLVTLFGAECPGQTVSDLGHYFVADAGNTIATGCAASVRAAVSTWLRGSVEYSLTNAQLIPGSNVRYLLLAAPSTVNPMPEHIQDVSTTVEARLRETATRVVGTLPGQQRLRTPAAGCGFSQRTVDRLSLRCPGSPVAPVHEVHERPVGNAPRGPEFLPGAECRRWAVGLRRAPGGPAAEAYRWRLNDALLVRSSPLQFKANSFNHTGFY